MSRERARALAHSQRCAALATALTLAACSAGLGASGGYLLRGPNTSSAGLKATALADLALIRGLAFALGVDGEVRQRLAGPGDAWGQWHLLALLGVTHLPQPSQRFVGYEALLTPGMARTYVAAHSELHFALGAQLGLPLRLSRRRPVWRADDLLGVGCHLVPSISALWFTRDTLALSAGLSVRVTTWSALTP